MNALVNDTTTCRSGSPVTRPMRTPDFLSTDHLRRNLTTRSVRGGVLTVGTNGIKFLLQLGSTAILARLLVPADFGLIAMVTAVVGLLSTIKDGGLSMATVQRADITQDQVSNLFWVNLILGALLFIAAAALSPAIAWFYNEPKLIGITLVISLSFFFIGLSVQHQALLQRQMQYVKLTAIQTAALAASVGSAIVLAAYGAGYWSLVMMHVVDGFVTALLSWILCPWFPGLPRRGAGTRKMLTFGGNLSAAGVLEYLSRNLDNILIGRVAGAGPLGFYNRAYSLLLLPVQQINWPLTSVAIPALSALQKDPESYRGYYKNALEIMAFAGMPLIVWLFIAAEEIILLVLGSQWQNAVIFFRALGPAAFMATTSVATSWVFITSGHTERLLKWGLFANTCCCLCIVLGLPWGPLGVALSVSISRMILKVPGLWYCYQETDIRLKDYWDSTWKPTISSIAAGVALFSIMTLLPLSVEHPAFQLGLISIGYLTFYVGIFNLLPHGHARFGRILKSLRSSLQLKPDDDVMDRDDVARRAKP